MGVNGYPIGATETALDIVEVISENGESGVTEIATALGCSKSTAFNQLKTLEQRGFVVQDGTQYRLGYRFLTHGFRVRRASTVMAVAQDVVDTLAETTDQLVSLVVPQQRFVYHLYQARGKTNQPLPIQVGEFESLWSCASGNVILSYLSSERIVEMREETVERDLPEISDLEFDSMGDRRISFGVRERNRSWQTIAAPILTMEDRPIGALEVIGSRNDFSGRASEIEIPGLILNAVKGIEKDLISQRI